MPHHARWSAPRPIGVALACAGLVGTLVSGSVLVDAWSARRAWLGSEEHGRIERQLDDPARDWPDRTPGGQRPRDDDGRRAVEAAGGRGAAPRGGAPPPPPP